MEFLYVNAVENIFSKITNFKNNNSIKIKIYFSRKRLENNKRFYWARV